MGLGLLLALLVACDGAPDSAPPDAPMDAALPPARLLSRLSLDLLGVRPTAEDLRAVSDDPAALEGLTEAMLADPRFGPRFAAAWSGVLGTEVTEDDHHELTYAVTDPVGLLRDMGQEPLRVMAVVADEDLPWTTLVTGDWTVVSDVTAALYPVEVLDDAGRWRRARFTDGRPAAGLLSTNGLWWRYGTTQGNANRGRANAITRVFTCRDYLDEQIVGDRDLDLLDADALADALRNSPSCVTCHHSLDPIGAALWGFYNHFGFSPTEQASYHAERERLWERHGGVAPAWYGQPVDGLEGLGRAIAADPRFVECAVRRTWEQLLQRPAGLDDTAALTAHREAFLAGGLTARALTRSVLADPRYTTDPGLGPGVHKQLTPDQLASAVEDLTGFRFRVDGVDVFEADVLGMRTMAGGAGADFAAAPVVEPTATHALVVERLAQAAAAWAVDQERLDPDAHDLITVPLDVDLPEDRRLAQLQALHLRVLGQDLPVDDPAIERSDHLWQVAVGLTGDGGDAWAAVLSTLLRSPDFLVY